MNQYSRNTTIGTTVNISDILHIYLFAQEKDISPKKYLLGNRISFHVINELAIRDYEKDGDMYIFPGCIANVNGKLLNKDDTKSPNDEKF